MFYIRTEGIYFNLLLKTQFQTQQPQSVSLNIQTVILQLFTKTIRMWYNLPFHSNYKYCFSSVKLVFNSV